MRRQTSDVRCVWVSMVPPLCVLTQVVFSTRAVALAALRQKQAYESELGRIAGTRLTLEHQVNAIETANLNAETMVAMKKGSEALKGIHGSLCVINLSIYIYLARNSAS